MSELHVRALHKPILVELEFDDRVVCEYCYSDDDYCAIPGSEQYPCRTLLALDAPATEPLNLWPPEPEPEPHEYGPNVRFWKDRPYLVKETNE